MFRTDLHSFRLLCEDPNSVSQQTVLFVVAIHGKVSDKDDIL